MKGLWKYIYPFAPDQSGVTAVLYELGGILVICDAGGCTGNICGFDEPRWFMQKSAVFSAGLRDMDAILGRDDRLAEKLCDAAAIIDADFAAIVGTPVPAVIGTDYKALKRMVEKKAGLPVLAIDTNGIDLYDVGEEKAWLELFRTFTDTSAKTETGVIGVIGATPLDTSDLAAGQVLRQTLCGEGWQQVICYGMGDGMEKVRQAGRAEKNIVIAPAGLKAAAYLQEHFGTPYEVRYPGLMELWKDTLPDVAGKKVLLMQQQVMANSLRQELFLQHAASVTVATWFMLDSSLQQEGDTHLTEEDSFTSFVQAGSYDLIIGDGLLKRALPDYAGIYADWPHFAVSGRMWHHES